MLKNKLPTQEEIGTLYSELQIVLSGDDNAELLVEAENALFDADLRKPLFLKMKDLANGIEGFRGQIQPGPWAYRCKVEVNGKPAEFYPLFRDPNGFALSFCYEADRLVLERLFYKEE